MQINGKTLLNSAENILRDRRQEGRTGQAASGQESARRTADGSGGVSSGVLESRLMKLQSDLGGIQRDYSREQARYEYLTRRPGEISADLLFGEEPLFPEARDGAVRPQELQGKVQGSMENLMRALKGVQVEMENLYALNFNNAPDYRPQIDAARLLESGGLKELDPSRVERLTRG